MNEAVRQVAAAEHFARMVEGPDPNIDLARAALLIAAGEYPDLDIDTCLSRLDFFAGECRRRLGAESRTGPVLEALNSYLYEELGFHGDLATFNDPRNSYLNDVIERRQGIPISLSVLYVEVARRLGVTVFGVSFPGHFLVKVADPAGELIIDPFSGGAVLDRAELQRRLQSLPGTRRQTSNLQKLLVSASTKEILARMLRNLKAIFLDREDYTRALDNVNMILSITPGSAAEIRDRAFIHDQLDHLRAAMSDYERYLMLAPDSKEADSVTARLADLRAQVGRMH